MQDDPVGRAQLKSSLTHKLKGFQESIMLCDARTEQLLVVFANHAAQKLLGGSSAALHSWLDQFQADWEPSLPAAQLVLLVCCLTALVALTLDAVTAGGHHRCRPDGRSTVAAAYVEGSQS